MTPAHLVAKMHMTLARVLAMCSVEVTLRTRESVGNLFARGADGLVLVGSAHDIQRIVLEAVKGGGDPYATLLNATMLFDEIDALNVEIESRQAAQTRTERLERSAGTPSGSTGVPLPEIRNNIQPGAPRTVRVSISRGF